VIIRPARRAFVVEFVPEPGVDAIKSFRLLLKFALRRLGLRAIDVRECALPAQKDERALCSTQEAAMSAFSERVRAQREEQKETGLFKIEHLKPNKELLLTVRHLDEQIEMFNKQVDLLNFEETGQQLPLNLTTAEWLIANLGDDPEQWAGKQVVLYLGEYIYNKETKQGIRLKLPGASTQTPTPPARKPASAPSAGNGSKSDMDDSIPF
jgi:hypothetical protein